MLDHSGGMLRSSVLIAAPVLAAYALALSSVLRGVQVGAVLLCSVSACWVAWLHGRSSAPQTLASEAVTAKTAASEAVTAKTALQRSSSKHRLPDLDPGTVQALIEARRSIFPKDYTGEEVENDAVESILQAAVWAPTHGKTEPWRCYISQSLAT